MSSARHKQGRISRTRTLPQLFDDLLFTVAVHFSKRLRLIFLPLELLKFGIEVAQHLVHLRSLLDEALPKLVQLRYLWLAGSFAAHLGGDFVGLSHMEVVRPFDRIARVYGLCLSQNLLGHSALCEAPSL